MSENPWISTSFGPMPIPRCAFTFIQEANKKPPRSRLRKKAQRYQKWVDIFAMKQYQAGVVFDQTMAPCWGEFDLHDMTTSQK